MGMYAPDVLELLPKPLDTKNGHTYAAPVWGIRGLRKQKRHEVVVGVDGEAIIVYNVTIARPLNFTLGDTDNESGPETLSCCFLRPATASVPLLSAVLALPSIYW